MLPELQVLNMFDSLPGGFQRYLTGACGYMERQERLSLQSAEPVIVWNRGNLWDNRKI